MNVKAVPAQTAKMVQKWLERNVVTFIIIASLLVLWEAYARYEGRDIYFPSLSYTYEQTMASRGEIYDAAYATFSSVTLAFIVAAVIGVVVGIIIAESFSIRNMTFPILVFAYSIPHAIMAPVFFIWFGIGETGITAFAAWVAFFPVFINTITGMNQLEEEFEQLGHVIGATKWQMLKYFRFWRAMPNISASMKVCVQLSIVGVIIAEFIATGEGLGFLIRDTLRRAQMGFTFGTIVATMLCAYLFYRIVEFVLDRVTPAQGDASSLY